ncbi:MAG: ABC transporter ATP-binding protein [Ruminococcaceae bacterium]|nr:ABC transporter ATP-binding protein [Oscillospiraceae bacterium]
MKKWMKYVKPYLLYFILGPLCMIIEVIGEVLMPLYLAEVINGAVYGTLTTESSLWAMVKMIGTAIMMMIGGVGGSYFGAKASVNFAADLRADLFRKVQTYSFANIDKFSTGSLVTRLTNDVTQLQNFVNMMLRMMLRSPGMLIGGVIMAIKLSPSLSIVMAVTIPLLLLAITFIIARGMPRFSKMQTKIDTLNSTVQENITNVRVVKSFVREDFETEKFGKANSELKGAGMSAMKNMIFMQPVQTFFMYITTGLVIWFGSQLVINNYDAGITNFSVGELSSFINYVSQILFSLMMVTMMLMISSRALASAKRIREVLDEDIDIKDADGIDTDAKIEGGKIEFRGVAYRYYKNSAEPVLSDINLTIEAGQTVGIIGSTGCGKTTLVSLIPRLYDADEGEILIDGKNVKDYSLYHLREGVGMVLQKNVLFSGTIEDNLRWGNENATDEEMMAAAESAQADKFVKNFTNGYQTELGQGGVNVSGGQKQRLCIARALLKNPKIIILDDSTSAVDTATEAQIRKAFSNELAASTKIIIAQRISSVKDADMIVVMDDGRITGVGTHDSLLSSNTEYQEIYNSQISGKAGA